MEKRKKGSIQEQSLSSSGQQSTSCWKSDENWTNGSMSKVVGRKTDPLFLLPVWKAILNLKKRDIKTTLAAVKAEIWQNYRYVSRFRFESSLRNACDEKLVLEHKIDNVTILDLPSEEDTALNHEVYCFTCFLPGEELWKCNGCYRAYHANCVSYSDESGKCFYCKPHIQRKIRERNLTVSDVNDLLDVMYHKLELPGFRFLRVIHASGFSEEEERIVHLLYKLLFCHDFSNSEIQRKLERNEYKSITECIRDYRQLVFNVCVIYGPNSEMGKTAQQLYLFVKRETGYMHNCFDCYVYYATIATKEVNNENIWFLMPCNPPHEIVFAKFKHFPSSPAKLIRTDRVKSYVWFFGEEHEDAWVSNSDLSGTLTATEPFSNKLKLALIEMEKYKFILTRYKNGKLNCRGIPRLESASNDSDSDTE